MPDKVSVLIQELAVLITSLLQMQVEVQGKSRRRSGGQAPVLWGNSGCEFGIPESGSVQAILRALRLDNKL